jgi:ABC-type nitrate/sulfonate/bicarbonate transport system substrate-binding protein
MALEEGAFNDRGIDLEWVDVPEGTGRMSDMLAQGETDLAVMLTEGAVKSIVDGRPLQIVQGYVESPLQWGIHVAGNSLFERIKDLEGRRAAISRYGSGSHLMAFVFAKNQGWNPEKLNFEVVNNMEGAIKALREGGADFFMWEHFTTQPMVSAGHFRRLGDCPTPWPCFAIAASLEILEQERGALRHVLEVINLYTSDFKQIPSIDRTLANRYGLQLTEVQKWLQITRWSQSQISSHIIDNVITNLLDLNLISKYIPADQVLTRL